MTSEMGNVNESVTLANADMRDVDGERRHDPLCPVLDPVNYWDDCQCDLIARVREDERAKREADGPWFRSVVHECCEKAQSERAAALRDAVSVLNTHRISGYFCSCGAEINSQAGHHAQVIEALGGER